MAKILKGTLYDKRIELEEEPELPSGTVVTVKMWVGSSRGVEGSGGCA